MLLWTSLHRRRATVETPGGWQCQTGGVRRLAVANGPNIFHMLLVVSVRELHREFLRSGSDVMQALTFYASDDKLDDRGNTARGMHTVRTTTTPIIIIIIILLKSGDEAHRHKHQHTPTHIHTHKKTKK